MWIEEQVDQMNPFILWGLGLILIVIECYLPGAIMGILGGILIFTGIILFAMQGHSPWWNALYLLANLISVGYIIKFALWRIRSAKPEHSIYSNKNQEGYIASHYDLSAVGKKGTVLTDLKPGGYILIEGKQHQALSKEGYITKGTEVLVIGGQEQSLIVKHLKKEEKP